MMLRLSPRCGGAVDGDVGDHAALDEFGLDEVADQLDVLLGVQFVAEAGVRGERASWLSLRFFGLLDSVPEARAVLHPHRRVLGVSISV